MRVAAASEMIRVERKAVKEGASERAFMVSAGRGIAEFAHSYIQRHDLEWSALLLCGKGNNSGDAYVAGMRLRQVGLAVRALQFAPLDTCSPLCREHCENFQKMGGEVVYVTDAIDWPTAGVIIDGLFGTGLSGEVKGSYAAGINGANASGLPILSIDIPSGLGSGTSIRAAVTLYLGLAKTEFFAEGVWEDVGRLHHIDFGLSREYTDGAAADLWLINELEAARLLPHISRSRHKYQAGFVVGIAGSAAMPGAAILASTAALRAGAGICRLYHPTGVNLHHCGLLPEVIAAPLPVDDEILQRADALFVGPGLGADQHELLDRVLERSNLVLDADALTMLAERDRPLPEGTILTPHRGEMSRLLGRTCTLRLAQEFADAKGVIVVLKGAPTFVCLPGMEPPLVAQRGDPGMATAGCGDVLTGLIASLLAQKLDPAAAATLGVYLHSVAGEIAAERNTSYAVIASDVTDALPAAYARLLRRVPHIPGQKFGHALFK